MRSRTPWAIAGIAAGALIILGIVYFALRSPAKAAQPMRHAMTGYVLEVTPEMKRITVRNDQVPGTMRSMVMDYQVKDTAALHGIKPGDVIQCTMAMQGDHWWLEDIKVVGTRN